MFWPIRIWRWRWGIFPYLGGSLGGDVAPGPVDYPGSNKTGPEVSGEIGVLLAPSPTFSVGPYLAASQIWFESLLYGGQSFPSSDSLTCVTLGLRGAFVVPIRGSGW